MPRKEIPGGVRAALEISSSLRLKIRKKEEEKKGKKKEYIEGGEEYRIDPDMLLLYLIVLYEYIYYGRTFGGGEGVGGGGTRWLAKGLRRGFPPFHERFSGSIAFQDSTIRL